MGHGKDCMPDTRRIIVNMSNEGNALRNPHVVHCLEVDKGPTRDIAMEIITHSNSRE